MVNIHEKYIKRCIQLAKNGLGSTYPNPLVGSVVVYKDKVIGEGWHLMTGKPHAEVNAINSVKDKSLFPKATIYVSLEPCSHFGKTPPCSDLIIDKGIKNVVIGSVDPYVKVSGRGIKKLMEAGCNVTVGILEKECADLNKRFFTFHTKKRPYIILKWAESKDRFISPLIRGKSEPEGKPVWITNKISRQLVHKWRSEEQSIMVGTQTALHDNPGLTTRDWYGKSPLRLVLDRKSGIPQNLSLFNGEAPTLVFTEVKSNELANQGVSYKVTPFDKYLLPAVLEVLYKDNIQSLIVEGGSYTINSFLKEGLWDEARVFTGNQTFKEGTPAPLIKGKCIKEQKIVSDKLCIWINKT